ncbi:hypothetical protein P6144_07580 [Sphingomonas sp. HITSZ_GF]|nr:hypothetical protein [Sphingomonas sp. HITSZ_GF]MDG2533500.1 hypothetical protein [Sphingomonas sp. HITSZ_GF]
MRILRIAGVLALASVALTGCYGNRPGYNGDRHHHRGDHPHDDHGRDHHH